MKLIMPIQIAMRTKLVLLIMAFTFAKANAITVDAGNNTSICVGTSVQLNATVSGGTPPYSYAWQPASILNDPGIANPTAFPINTITILVTVTDALGVEGTDSVIITVYTNPIVNVGNDTTVCFGSTVQLDGHTVNGLTYMWSPQTGLTSGFISNPAFTAAGNVTYTLIVSDVHGCTSSDAINISVDNPVVNLTVTSVTCNGGSDGNICAAVTGGTPPYTYNWSNTVQNMPCDTALSANFYAITVNDAFTCTVTATATVSQPTALTITNSTIHNPACNQPGWVDVTVSGGTAPFNYLWSDGQTAHIPEFTDGIYTFTITDANGCNITGGPDTIVTTTGLTISSWNMSPAHCSNMNGSLCPVVSGGSLPYNYLWSTTSTAGCITSMGYGLYSVTITDFSGCSVTGEQYITDITSLEIDSIHVNPIPCVGTGGLCAFVSGGTTPYSYLWNDGSINSCLTSASVDGDYVVTVTDAAGCHISDSRHLSHSTLDLSNADIVSSTCGADNGAICLHVAGGTSPYTYNWSPGVGIQNDSCPAGLAAGLYIVTVTDFNACSASIFFAVNQISPFSINLTASDVLCYGQNNGRVWTTITGPPTNYTFSSTWSNNFTGVDSNLAPGNYEVTVTDDGGCSQSVSFSINQPASALSMQVYTIGPVCGTDTVGVILNGGTPPYLMNWGDGVIEVGAPAHIYAGYGPYLIGVMDANGCTVVDSINISATCVWPGDANYDGVVDNNDLLPIGLAYGSTGFARTDQSILYTPHACQNWPDTLAGGSNYKHVDCDGNGTINADDTAAIAQNFSLTHPRGAGSTEWRSGAAELKVHITPDTLADGQTVIAHISLGDSLIGATDVYALAFTFNYDPIVVDSNSVNITFGNSWLAGTGDHIDLNKKLLSVGEIKTAITRIDHVTRSGNGEIAEVKMIITTGNINGKNTAYYHLMCWLSNISIIDNAGRTIPVNAVADSTSIEYTPTDINKTDVDNGDINIYPNPAKNLVAVNSLHTIINSIQVFDITGHAVISIPAVNAGQTVIDFNNIVPATYIIRLTTGNTVVYRRVLKMQ